MIFTRRAQMMGQIFVFILALVIFSGVLLYGYRAIFTIQEGVEDAAFFSFSQELQAKVEQVSVDFGSVRKFRASPPGSFTEICFLDLKKLETDVQGSLTKLRNTKPLISDAVEGGTDQNVFFTPLAKTPTTVARLEIDGGFICIPLENRDLILRLEGLGDRTKLSEWKSS